MIGGKPVGYLQSLLDMSQGSLKTNPESGQSRISTRNIRTQIYDPDRRAMLSLPPPLRCVFLQRSGSKMFLLQRPGFFSFFKSRDKRISFLLLLFNCKFVL